MKKFMKNNTRSIRSFLAVFIAICFVSIVWSTPSAALIFPLPPAGTDVVGQVQITQALPGDSFSSIGRRFDVGYFQLVEANPGINPDQVPAGTIVVVPSKFVLPPVPRKGIVISLAELRLYYYPPNSNEVITYPVGIGRQGWSSPLGITKVVEKTVNPVWVVPDSIKQDRAKQGVFLPASVPPGPDNPLGGYRMRLGIENQTYLIHGTNDYTGVGRRSSSGCVRMLPEDVEELFQKVTVGTQVNIVNNAYKAGWSQGKLYLEAHEPLQEQQLNGDPLIATMKQVVQNAIKTHSGVVYWNKAEQVASSQNGVPQTIGGTG